MNRFAMRSPSFFPGHHTPYGRFGATCRCQGDYVRKTGAAAPWIILTFMGWKPDTFVAFGWKPVLHVGWKPDVFVLSFFLYLPGA